MRNLQRDILEEFALVANQFGKDRPATDAGGLEALRRAYRERHISKGLCRSCPSHAVPGRRSCAKHLQDRLASASAYYHANRKAILARRKQKRRTRRLQTS